MWIWMLWIFQVSSRWVSPHVSSRSTWTRTVSQWRVRDLPSFITKMYTFLSIRDELNRAKMILLSTKSAVVAMELVRKIKYELSFLVHSFLVLSNMSRHQGCLFEAWLENRVFGHECSSMQTQGHSHLPQSSFHSRSEPEDDAHCSRLHDVWCYSFEYEGCLVGVSWVWPKWLVTSTSLWVMLRTVILATFIALVLQISINTMWVIILKSMTFLQSTRF